MILPLAHQGHIQQWAGHWYGREYIPYFTAEGTGVQFFYVGATKWTEDSRTHTSSGFFLDVTPTVTAVTGNVPSAMTGQSIRHVNAGAYNTASATWYVDNQFTPFSFVVPSSYAMTADLMFQLSNRSGRNFTAFYLRSDMDVYSAWNTYGQSYSDPSDYSRGIGVSAYSASRTSRIHTEWHDLKNSLSLPAVNLFVINNTSYSAKTAASAYLPTAGTAVYNWTATGILNI